MATFKKGEKVPTNVRLNAETREMLDAYVYHTNYQIWLVIDAALKEHLKDKVTDEMLEEFRKEQNQ